MGFDFQLHGVAVTVGGVSTRQVLGRVLAVGSIAVLGVVLVSLLAPAGARDSYRPTGAPREIPEGRLQSVTLQQFDGILLGLRGTPVVVNVWASWCAPCRAEMPLLDRAADEYDGQVVFLGVASKDSREEAGKFLQEVDADYPSVFDPSGDVRQALGLRGFPTTYFFDAEGELVASLTGGVSEPRLAAQLEDLTD